MKAELIKHEKITDELGNTVEIKMWEVPESDKESLHSFKYSLVYVVNGERVIGYDNAEGKGDHRHCGNKEAIYNFVSLNKLIKDFYSDLGLTQKQLNILAVDPSRMAALQKLEICLIFLKFSRLTIRAPQHPKM